MTHWAREELEQAFETYQRVAAEAGRTGDWASWADLFTEDGEYVEHLYGTMRGREAIRAWISETMSTYPGNAMPAFPIGWSVIDEDKGWVICQVWNRMEDPGDGSIHQAYNVTILKYAGDGRWSYEEDIYNPAHFASMIKAWEQRKTELARP
ncbi:MAG: nuclear transport factor 2 family protein [Acidimicrobiia bacterium]|nr:nuclear transport factor 2 family protein [Acidimicrobiia bacterium]